MTSSSVSSATKEPTKFYIEKKVVNDVLIITVHACISVHMYMYMYMYTVNVHVYVLIMYTGV